VNKNHKTDIRQFLVNSSKNYAIIYVVAMLFIVLSFASKSFLSGENALNILRQSAITAILGAAEFFVIISGMIDLSIASTLALSGVIYAMIIKAGGLIMMPAAILAVIIIGAVVGIINGLIVSKFGIPPFITSLGTMLIVRGVVFLITSSYPIIGMPDWFKVIGLGNVLGVIPVPMLIVVAVYLFVIIVSEKKLMGRFFYAIGGNEEAAYLSGIKVARYKTYAYMLCGILAALAGIVMASRLNSGQPNAAQGYEFEGIIAVVIGGVSFAGGKGKALGVLFGAIFIATLMNGMTILSVDSYLQQVIKGVVFIVAIGLDVYRNRKTK